MRERLRRWINNTAIRDPIEIRKAEFLTVMIIGLFVLGLVGTPISFLTPLSPLQKLLTVSADLMMSAFMGLALLVMRRGRLNSAVLLTICGMLVPLAMTFSALGAARGGYVLVAFLLPVVLAGVMADVSGLIFTIIASSGIVSIILIEALARQPDLPLPTAAIISVFTLIAIVLGVFLHRFSQVLERTINEMLVRERELELSRLVLERNMSALEREIIERRRAEFALRESDDKFRALVTHSPVGIFQATPDGEFLFVNKQWSDLISMLPEAALGKGWQVALYPADAAHVIENWQECVSQGRPFAQEYRFLLPDGQVRWVFSTAEPLRDRTDVVLGYFGIISDITENKLTREALRESEERYRLITENTDDLINMFLLGRQVMAVYSSPSYQRVLGYVPGSNGFGLPATMFHPDDLPDVMNQFALMRTRAATQLTVRVKHADGSWRWIEAKASALVRDGQRYVITVGRDITDRKRLEAQFLQAQKMEGVGQLAGGIAHDFNNLLTAILGNTDLALDSLAPDDPVRADVNEIASAAERAVGLTRQLLAFARKQILEPRVIDANRLILDMDGLLRRLIGENIELRTRVFPHLWRVKGDPTQIEQVIVNMAVNARDAMPRGGRLVIETANNLLDALAQEYIGVLPGSYVAISISDTGTGMDEETQRRVFEPFFTTKPPGRGTGLGLATSYGIIKQHGGTILLHSTPGVGTRFTIYLPGIDAPIEELLATALSDELPRGSETILLVEDEAAVRSLTARVLRSHGYQVFEAPHGRAALQLVDETPNLALGLVITDVVMPQMSGRETAEQLELRFPGVKVLYISGYTDQAIDHEGQLNPGIEFLHKPFTPGTLLRKVRDVLNNGG